MKFEIARKGKYNQIFSCKIKDFELQSISYHIE